MKGYKEESITTYQESIISYIKKLIKEYGNMRKTGKAFDVSPSVLCRIIKGKYIPKPQTIAKKFPDFDFSQCSDFSTPVFINKTAVSINCIELEELKEQLNKIGYEIRWTLVQKGA